MPRVYLNTSSLYELVINSKHKSKNAGIAKSVYESQLPSVQQIGINIPEDSDIFFLGMQLLLYVPNAIAERELTILDASKAIKIDCPVTSMQWPNLFNLRICCVLKCELSKPAPFCFFPEWIDPCSRGKTPQNRINFNPVYDPAHDGYSQDEQHRIKTRWWSNRTQRHERRHGTGTRCCESESEDGIV